MRLTLFCWPIIVNINSNKMAGRTHKTGGGSFLRVVEGRLFRKSNVDDPKAKERRYKDPSSGEEKVMYGEWVDDWYGWIVGVEKKQSNFSDSEYELEIRMKDGEESCTIQVKWGGRICYDFLYRLCNPDLDVTKKVVLSPWKMEGDDGKPLSGLSIIKDGESKSVPKFFKKGDLPDWNPVEINGKVVYDRTEHDKVLLEKVAEVVAKMSDSSVSTPQDLSAAEIPLDADSGHYEEEEDDNLPF